MKYLSTKEVSIKWNIDQSLVLRLLKNKRIDGAIKIGNSWAIPDNALKPIDKRTKIGKKTNKESFFRFPLYINFDEDFYNPPLTDEEKQLRNIQLSFYSGNLDDIEDKATSLLNNTKNRYLIIACLYYLLMIYQLNKSDKFNQTLLRFKLAFQENFPYKKEMLLFKYFFDINNSDYKSSIEEFNIDLSYKYHPSCYYLLCIICLITIENGNLEIINKLRYDSQELLCIQMENDGYYFEAQHMHFLLLIFYQTKNDHDKMQYHASRGIELAYKHRLYLYAGSYTMLYPHIINKILKDYPIEFSNTIYSIVNLTKKNENNKALLNNKPSYLGILDENDFELAFIANQGYTYREIANKLKMSEKEVYKKYSEIYDKLNVKSKQELIDLINKTHLN